MFANKQGFGFGYLEHSAGNTSELPDCFLMGALSAAHVWVNALYFVESKNLKHAAKSY